MFHSKQKAVRELSLITTETDLLKKGGGGVYFRGITWFSGEAEGRAEGHRRGEYNKDTIENWLPITINEKGSYEY